jgi:GGDEF domain-containing protein
MDEGNRRILELSNEPQLVLGVTDDEELVIDGVNDEFVQLTHFDRSDLRGRPLRTLAVDPESFPEETIISNIRNLMGERYVFEAKRPDDIPYELAINVVPQSDRLETPESGITYATNYTDWKLWRPARRDFLTGAWDEYTFRLYLTRTLRRAHLEDRSFGLIDVEWYDDEFGGGLSGVANQLLHDLIDRIRNHCKSRDVITRRLDSVLTIIRPTFQGLDEDLESLCRNFLFELENPLVYCGEEYDFECDITWSKYPEQSNTVESMLGYEQPLVA